MMALMAWGGSDSQFWAGPGVIPPPSSAVPEYRYTGGARRVDTHYCYHVFKWGGFFNFDTTQQFSPITGQPAPPWIDVFLVGTGGYADIYPPTGIYGTGPRAGGGGGEVVTHNALAAPTSTVDVTVAAQSYTPRDTVFDPAGLNVRARPGVSLYQGDGNFDPKGGTGGASGEGNAGGAGNATVGGGGGGAAGLGQAAQSATVPGRGGDGVTNTWEDGTPKVYGCGGHGGTNLAPGGGWQQPGDPTGWAYDLYGGGHGGCARIPGDDPWADLDDGTPPCSGLVIVRYLGA